MIEDFIDKIKYKLNFCYIDTIFDLGARDMEQSIEFSKYFPSVKIYAFEANPTQYGICLENIKDYPNITLVSNAVSNQNGLIDFYPIDENSPVKNPGASSCYPISELYRSKENLRQKHITVPSIRLDTFCKENNVQPDLLWIDIEGAELPALAGLGDYIDQVQAIYVETTFQPLYVGNTMFDELNTYLTTHRKFDLIHKPNELYRGDCVFLNRKFVNKS